MPSTNDAGSSFKPEVGTTGVLERSGFPILLKSVSGAGYQIVGPTVKDGAIVYGDISSVEDLPVGITERQEAGTYKLEKRPDAALFGYNLGPQSWKKFLYPPKERLWTARRFYHEWEVTPEEPDDRKLAFLGIRACELSSIEVQDKVFMGKFVDPSYKARRGRILCIAVQCTQSAPTCFCTSMGTGPEVKTNFDLSLTEIIGPQGHHFLVSVGTEAGVAVLKDVPMRHASTEDIASCNEVVARTGASMIRHLDNRNVRTILLGNLEHARWDDVARRCLACTNCTMVCPTCFCSTNEEVPSLDGDTIERNRRWDSCFNSGFTEVHGHPVRASTRSRYRQWLTHKLATWYDQFGTSGCVGCGRCISWCPVGIDLTEEVAAISSGPSGKVATEVSK